MFTKISAGLEEAKTIEEATKFAYNAYLSSSDSIPNGRVRDYIRMAVCKALSADISVHDVHRSKP